MLMFISVNYAVSAGNAGFNTSYVNVYPVGAVEDAIIDVSFNTSYVNVYPDRKKAGTVLLSFQYILC